MNWSCSRKDFVTSSGSANTPISSPQPSPMERVNAQPGPSAAPPLSVLAKSRAGSPEFSSSSTPSASSHAGEYLVIPSIMSRVRITEPAFLHRSRSSRRYGVWSCESGTAITCWPRRSPMIARLSPTLATCILSPRKRAVTAVVPECSASNPCCPSIWSLSCKNVCLRAASIVFLAPFL